jgi:hypothetical protein
MTLDQQEQSPEGNEMTHPIAQSRPLLTVRNLAVVATLIAGALLLWLVVARTGQSAQTATFTQVHHIHHPWR